jgi:sugar/nucleoside kinase (ribokinase family)
MQTSAAKPLDYLTIGHITKDLAASGFTLGGTAAYSTLTARAFGLKSAIFSAYGPEIDIAVLHGIAVFRKNSEKTTTFENIDSQSGRKQYLYETAAPLLAKDVPESISSPRVLHLGPVANEVEAEIAYLFPDSFLGLTPQGWMRSSNAEGLVEYQEWHPSKSLMEKTDAVVVSIEDVRGNEDIISELANQFNVLAVTEGSEGARVYWHGDVRRFRAPKVAVKDLTGAGDIFAAAFFIRLEATCDPWESAALAVNLASLSVTRAGLMGVPSQEEVKSNLVEIIRGSTQP